MTATQIEGVSPMIILFFSIVLFFVVLIICIAGLEAIGGALLKACVKVALCAFFIVLLIKVLAPVRDRNTKPSHTPLETTARDTRDGLVVVDLK
jgi:hypothetical protein